MVEKDKPRNIDQKCSMIVMIRNPYAENQENKQAKGKKRKKREKKKEYGNIFY